MGPRTAALATLEAITAKTSARKALPPSTPCSPNLKAKGEATDAATIPRGAIAAKVARSGTERSEP